MDINSLIAQTEALSWDDPTSQIESLTSENTSDECLPLVGHVISQKTHNNQFVFATLSKAWEFAIPFSFAVLGPNKFLFKLSKQVYLLRIQKQVTWNVNGSTLESTSHLRRTSSQQGSFLDPSTWPPSFKPHSTTFKFQATGNITSLT
jgi:hypothetical protein